MNTYDSVARTVLDAGQGVKFLLLDHCLTFSYRSDETLHDIIQIEKSVSASGHCKQNARRLID